MRGVILEAVGSRMGRGNPDLSRHRIAADRQTMRARNGRVHGSGEAILRLGR
jgi:hypothetical protein